MNPCLVVQRLTIGAVPPTEGALRRVSPPDVEAIRFVYGVGDEASELPAGSVFRTVYAISIPVARLGGLDLDDVYEFDAALMLATLQERARQRRWAMRLEFDLIQTHESATSAELYVEAPTGVSMILLGHTGYGMPNPGGGRSLKIATGLAHSPESVLRLAGPYQLMFRDVDPRVGGAVGVESPVQVLKIGLSEYEFES